MLDVKMVRANPDEVRRALQRRGDPTSSLDEFLAVEERRRQLLTEVESRRAARKRASDEIAAVKKAGGDADEAIAAMRALGDQIKEHEAALAETEERLNVMLLELPNIPLPDVPDGGEEDSVVVRTVGTPREFDFEPRDHLDLGLALDLIDMERAAKVSGSRFVYLKGDLVMLQFALVNYALTVIQSKGFRPVIPPCSCAKRPCTAPASSPPTEPRSTRRWTAIASWAPARSRSRRCTWRSSSTRRRSRSGTPATPRASGARPAPPAATRAASCACTSSTRSRCSASARPSRARPSTW